MAGALQAARDRIAADTQHADQLTKDLAAAKAKLKTLEASIKKAAAAQTSTVTVVTTRSSSGSSGSGSHEDDGGEAGDD